MRYLLLTSRGIYGRFSPVSAHRSPFFLPLPAMIAVGFAGGPADAELYLRRRWPFLKNHPFVWELAPLSPKLGGQELRSFNSRFDLWRLNITQCGVNRIDASLPVSAL